MFLSEQNVIIALEEEVRGGCALSSFFKISSQRPIDFQYFANSILAAVSILSLEIFYSYKLYPLF